jgi:hypothetical protein
VDFLDGVSAQHLFAQYGYAAISVIVMLECWPPFCSSCFPELESPRLRQVRGSRCPEKPSWPAQGGHTPGQQNQDPNCRGGQAVRPDGSRLFAPGEIRGLSMKRGWSGQSASEFWRKQIGDFIDVLGRAVFEKFARRFNETLETSCFCDYSYEQNCVVFGTVIFTHEDLSTRQWSPRKARRGSVGAGERSESRANPSAMDLASSLVSTWEPQPGSSQE